MKLEFTKIQKLEGGSIHEVWMVILFGEKRILKILNPSVSHNIVQTEAFAQYCFRHSIPAVCALEIEGKILHAIDNCLGLFYPFIPGRQKYYPNFGLLEVNKIATLLAKIHNLGSISHRDFDPKNVLWVKDEPHIIDWECAGEIDPMEEVIALAYEWSGFERGEIDATYFSTFIATYQAAGGKIIKERLTQGLQGFIRNYKNWLEFNVQRLHVNCLPDEKAIAIREISRTEKKLIFLNNNNALSLIL